MTAKSPGQFIPGICPGGANEVLVRLLTVFVLGFACTLTKALCSEAISYTTLAGNSGYGSADGTGRGARFNFPAGLAVDSASTVYVADTQNSTVRKVAPDGATTTLA